jgi:Xaa-Pro aminopeptidase
MQHFMGSSFEAISSVGANGAIIHYKPEENGSATINANELYLLDSGGSYMDGTTDTTRAVHFGTPREQERDSYTRVLCGNLSLAMAKWPKNAGISGAELDILARMPLWEAGKDFNHGTGHGVGYFLCVHEGPQGISRARKVVLQPGM